MAKSIAAIMSQIDRLQKEASAIQNEVIGRIRKDIARYGLSPEHLFGPLNGLTKIQAKATVARAPKYADSSGNTWGGMGKRPGWLRQALDAGSSLDDFLIGSAARASGRAKPASTAGQNRRSKANTKAQTKVTATKKTLARRVHAGAEPSAAE